MKAHNSYQVEIFGVASCIGAQNMLCNTAPLVLRNLGLEQQLEQQAIKSSWQDIIYPTDLLKTSDDKISVVANICKQLASKVHHCIENHNKFLIVSGDHSSAIGTWSGAAAAIENKGELGLLWIDAHMDSHTMLTSPSKAIHGMPVACLLGIGDEKLINIETAKPKIKPENLCLLGIRSYEPEEKILLEQLGVKVFYMEDIKRLGITEGLRLALEHVQTRSKGFGISIDLDAFDPKDAPGVGSRENDGIIADDFLAALAQLTLGDDLLGVEIAELNSSKDSDDKTAWLAIKLAQLLLK